MAENSPTHILKVFKSQNVAYLFRASDGMLIAMRKLETVIFGDDPNHRQGRVFIDGDHAMRYIEAYAQTDHDSSKVETARIERIDGEPLIELPADSLGFPKHGAINPLRN